MPETTLQALLSLPPINSYEGDPDVSGPMRPIVVSAAQVAAATEPVEETTAAAEATATSEPEQAPAPTHEDAPAPAPAPERKGRFGRAMSLFGKAFRTLFSDDEE